MTGRLQNRHYGAVRHGRFRLVWMRDRLRWAVAGNSGAKTRLHNLRGEFWGHRVIRDILPALRRNVGEWPAEPWVPLPVIRWLERHRRPDWRVLELGGGMSTVWWSTRAAEVVTLEDNAEWAQRLADRLGDSPTVTLLVLPREEWWAWLAEERAFDLVYVDAADAPPDFTRVKLLEAAHHLVAPGGWLALDDSDRPRYGGADAVVGWPATQVGGLKGTPFAVTETTFYHRPA